MKIDIIMFNMSTFFDWDHGVVNRNYNILHTLAKDDRVQKIIGVDFFPIGLRKAAKHYFQNILLQVKTAEMVYGDLTSACYQRTEKIYAFSTIDSIFSWKKVANELHRVSRNLNLKNVVFWSYNPMFVEFIGIMNEKMFVFDAVDNWSEHPGYVKLVGKRKLLRNYEIIAGKADVIFTVSSELLPFYKNFGRENNTFWIPNGVDFDHFNDEKLLCMENELTGIEKPIIGYLGTIQERIDLDLIAYLAEKNPDKIVALCGPIWPVIKKQLEKKLQKFNNIILTGRVKFEHSPSYINRFDVAIIPHKVDDFLKSTNPMKMYEFLSAGKPIVSTAGAGVDMFKEYIRVSNDPEEFNRMISEELKNDSEEKRVARRRAVGEHSWNKRVSDMLNIIYQNSVKL
jgi:teichuronic acid biosynthesis glycosyltransferase TuaH